MNPLIRKLTVPGAAVAAALLCRSQYERKHMITRSCEVILPGRAADLDGLSLAFLSDLHDNELGPDNTELLSAVKAAAPDIILVGGDMPTVKPWRKKDFGHLEHFIGELSETAPIYYALGNHEQRMKEKRYSGWWTEYCRILRKNKCIILDNSSREIAKGGACLRISGLSLDERYYRKGRAVKAGRGVIERSLGPRTEKDYELLLAHNPLYLDAYADWGADLVLSGHLHGGTIRIPGLGGLMTPQFQFFSPYTKGQLKKDKTNMIVSAGLGTHSINIRLNNRPELVIIRLKKA